MTTKWDAFIARMIDKGILTKKHFDWVQKVWDLTESLKPEAQKAWHEINGFYFKEVEASARTRRVLRFSQVGHQESRRAMTGTSQPRATRAVLTQRPAS